MSNYHINVFWSDDDDGYIADIPDLDGCSAFGETPEQALADVDLAKSSVARGRSGNRACGTRAAVPPRPLTPADVGRPRSHRGAVG
jgi:hypothetical protein